MTHTPTRHARILFDQRVPMRDGVTLSADIYFTAETTKTAEIEEAEAQSPVTSQPIADRQSLITNPQPPVSSHPVLLLRTPYQKATDKNVELGKYFAAHGYVVVIMDVRGRGDSDGAFVPYFKEGLDGYDSIEWCAAQPWCNGKVATMGSSYLGAIQWLTALQHPPHLVTMVVRVTPSDPFVEWPTGTQSPMHLCWIHYTSGRANQIMDAVDWNDIYRHLPLLTMDDVAGRHSPIWREQMQHLQLDDYWKRRCYQDKFDTLDLPVLHISGWYDDEQIGTPLNFMGMTQNGAGELGRHNQRLIMGPWGHQVNTTSKLGDVDFGPQALIDLRGMELAWLDRWMKDEAQKEEEQKEEEKSEAPVRIFVMGENTWRDEQEWPLARTRWTPYYLHSGGNANSRFGDGVLSTEKPEQQPPDRFRYDPARPVPFITDPVSSQIGGPDDYAAILRRDDVLVYVTAPLQEEIEITGPIRLQLYAASSAMDTDFTAQLLDVHPTSFAQRLCDGMVRARFREGMDTPQLLQPHQVYEFNIDLWNTSQLFLKGHRIALQISSSAFPKYDRNLNNGEDLARSTRMVVARQVVYHDAQRPSALMLPVIPR